MRRIWGVALLLTVLAAPAGAVGDTSPYLLKGYVRCDDGSPVSGASITAWNNNTSESLRSDLKIPPVTGANGFYSFDIGKGFPSGWATGQQVRIDATGQGISGSVWVVVDGSKSQYAGDILLSCPSPTPTPGGFRPTPTPEAAPSPLPRFDVSGLLLEPSPACAGANVTVSAEVANRGDAPGSYELVLRLDGPEAGRATVALGVNESRKVSIPLAAPSQPGAHMVEAGPLSAFLRVEPCPSPGSPLPPANVAVEETHRFSAQAGEEVVLTFNRTDVVAILFTARVDMAGSVSVRQLTERPPGVPAPPEALLRYLLIELEVPPRFIADARIRFRVDPLEGRPVDPAKVALQRFHEGGWQTLETLPLGERTYEAATPGFSLFAVTGPEPPPPAAILPHGLREILVPIAEPLARSPPLALLAAALAAGGAGALLRLRGRR